MFRPVLAAVPALAVFACPSLAASANPKIEAELMKLSPDARKEQRCDGRAMGQVSRDHPGMQPAEIVAYAYRDTKIAGTRVSAPGAAIHIGTVWYHLAYTCQTSEDGLDVGAFSYTLGKPIPRAEWSEHQLTQ